LFSHRDNIPTVCLGSWPLKATLFDGEVIGGPVPLLFGADPEAAKTSLLADPAKTQKDVVKINRSILAWEYVLLKDSIAVVKKPR